MIDSLVEPISGTMDALPNAYRLGFPYLRAIAQSDFETENSKDLITEIIKRLWSGHLKQESCFISYPFRGI